MDRNIFKQRRQAALERMGDGVLVLFAAPSALRNNDVEHSYRQDSDFYYLTGLEEPEAVLVLAGGSEPKFTLFVRPRDAKMEIWNGPRTGVEGAQSEFGADQAYPIAELPTKLAEELRNHEEVFFALGRDEPSDRRFIQAFTRATALARKKGWAPSRISSVTRLLHELRRVKQPEELEVMRKANSISQAAHLRAMSFAAPGRYEYELQAVLEHEFRMGGAPRCAYESIVGSGPNATILHHVQNQRRIEAGDLVLIDAGCEHGYYASDITRTFPANGRFTQEQRNLYDIVLQAQLDAISAVKPGATFESVHQVARDVITAGLIELGLIEGPLEKAVEEGFYKPFFMHKTGHYLGMDVHDVGAYRQQDEPVPFEPGVVLTVEPGIYVATDNQDVPLAYRGIGIRIEDDVLVTENGCENLTHGLAKTIDEVERACAG